MKRLVARLEAHWPYVAFAVVFVASRLIYRGEFGVRFDPTPVYYFIQFLDPWFFENDFLRSILYLHQQAPLPNFVVGCAWLAFGPKYAFLFLDGVFLMFGATLGMVLIATLGRLGASRVLSVVVVCALAVTPAFVIYECWLFYHMPVASLMCCSLWALLRFYRRGTFSAALAFFGLLAVIALIRNVYGTVWLGAVTAGLLLFPPIVGPQASRVRRTILKAAIGPLLLLVAMNAKTSILLGRSFGGAAIWTNVVTKIWEQLPSEDQERLLEDGEISKAVLYEPFDGVDNLESVRTEVPKTGVPLLDLERMYNGRENPHTLEYLVIAEKYYVPDGKLLLKRYPRAYATSVYFSLFDWYPSSPTRDIIVPRTANYMRLHHLDRRINKLAGRTGEGRLTLLVVMLPAALAYGIYRVLRTRARLASERSIVAAILFMLLTIGYAALGTTLVSYADFSRYRFDVDPFYLVLVLLMATQLGRFVLEKAQRVRRA